MVEKVQESEQGYVSFRLPDVRCQVSVGIFYNLNIVLFNYS